MSVCYPVCIKLPLVGDEAGGAKVMVKGKGQALLFALGIPKNEEEAWTTAVEVRKALLKYIKKT